MANILLELLLNKPSNYEPYSEIVVFSTIKRQVVIGALGFLIFLFAVIAIVPIGFFRISKVLKLSKKNTLRVTFIPLLMLIGLFISGIYSYKYLNTETNDIFKTVILKVSYLIIGLSVLLIIISGVISAYRKLKTPI